MNLSLRIIGLHRVSLWLLLIILTVTVLIFPTHLTLEYYAIQSIRIFDNLPLFAVLFCAWLAALLLLLFSRKGEEDNIWEKLALVCIFSAVFLGFWTIVTHTGLSNEGIYNAAHVKYLNEVGIIPLSHTSLGYFDAPGLHLIGTFISQITGWDPIAAAALIVFSQALLLSSLLFVFFRRLLNNQFVVSLAVLLMIQGNISLDKINIFHPRNLGLVLLAIFLVLVARNKGKLFSTLPDSVLILIVAAATTMTHVVSSFLLFFILFGLYIVQKLHKEKSENITTLAFFLILPLIWAIYWAVLTLQSVVGVFPKVLSDFAAGGNVFWVLTMIGNANIGGSIPLWANITRLFWWVVIYGFSSILWIWNLFNFKKLSTIERKITGILLGIIFVSTVSIVASVGGGRFDTYILYGTFALVPILLWFLIKLRNALFKYALIGLVVIFFTLSFPTFLSHNNMVEFDAYYPDENVSGKFLESQFGMGENLHLSGVTWLQLFTAYYVPNASMTLVHEVVYLKNENGLWADFKRVIDNFEGGGDRPGTNVIFMWSERVVIPYDHFFGVSQQNPKWQEQIDRLSQQNRIYDNGNSQMYWVGI